MSEEIKKNNCCNQDCCGCGCSCCDKETIAKFIHHIADFFEKDK